MMAISNLRPTSATHPYLGGPWGSVRLMTGSKCARARSGWSEESLEPDGGGGGGTLSLTLPLGYEAATMTLIPIAIGLNLHYKTNSRIIRRIIRFGLVVEYHPDYQVNYQPDYRLGSAEVPAW